MRIPKHPHLNLPRQATSMRRLLSLLLPILLFLAASPAIAAGQNADDRSETIIVGGDANYPPYEFLDKDGKPAGYNVELTRAIAEVMGMNVEIRLGPWSEMRRALNDREVDILQGMAFSEERTREVDFSPPHAIVYQTIWTRKGEEISSIGQLRGKEVIVMRHSVMHDFMLQHNLDAAYVQVDSLADALRLLSAGQHDAALVAKLPGQYLVKELGLTNIVPQARPIIAQKYGYAVKKGNTEILERFSEGLAILKRSGRYQAIHNKWLGVLEPQPISWQKIARYVAMVAAPLVLILAGTVVWSRTLQKRVAQRTGELAREVREKERALDDLRLHQDKLVQADKMASLGILLSGVAHEINNPNALILLNMPRFMEAFTAAEPILETYYREHGDFLLGCLKYSRMREELPLMLEETLNGARQIRSIVDDLKDFARRDDSGSSVTFDLNDVVRAATRLADSTIRKSTRRFSLDCSDHLPMVRGSAQRIEQVVVNLLVNACQALEHSDQPIVVTTSCAPDGAVVLSVEDGGRGIPPDHLPYLMDPFFTTKREQGGTGLGLWVSAGIVREHDGTLTFAPAPAGGTIVTLTLPPAKEN
ncbi:MAG TPA: transporter substrate-binding domain-containing protein [Desulfuromonadaceae bacterium]